MINQSRRKPEEEGQTKARRRPQTRKSQQAIFYVSLRIGFFEDKY
jgi:hypothetical protein